MEKIIIPGLPCSRLKSSERDALEEEIAKRLERRMVIKNKILLTLTNEHLRKYEAINLLDEIKEFIRNNFDMSGDLK